MKIEITEEEHELIVAALDYFSAIDNTHEVREKLIDKLVRLKK